MKADIQELWDRVNTSKQAQAEQASAQSEVLARVESLEQQNNLIWLKLEDLTNRYRRNNIRIRGAPSGAEGSDIETYVQDLFRVILQKLNAPAIVLDRTHRDFIPARREASLVLNILTGVHFFKEKEERLATMRKLKDF